MKLEDKHKEYAVKCYARFMTRSEVVEAFIEEFKDDLPEPPPIPEFPYTKEDYKDDNSIEAKLAKDKFIADSLADYGDRYCEAYGKESFEKFNEDLDKIHAEIEQAYNPKNDFLEDKQKHLDKHQNVVKNHNEKVKRNLSTQLRRFNITHRQFPDKYRNLFNQVRKEYFSSYRSESLHNSDNVELELETLYGYVKQRIFNEGNPKEVMKHVNLAHQILKTIVTCNAISTRQEVVDVTPQKKPQQDTQKELSNQSK